MVLLGGRTGLKQPAGDLGGPDEVGAGQLRGGGTPARAGTRGRKAGAALKPRTRKGGGQHPQKAPHNQRAGIRVQALLLLRSVNLSLNVRGQRPPYLACLVGRGRK